MREKLSGTVFAKASKEKKGTGALMKGVGYRRSGEGSDSLEGEVVAGSLSYIPFD
jgi:hypothetical protein